MPTKKTVKRTTKSKKVKSLPISYHFNSFMFLLFVLGLFGVGLVMFY